MGKADPDGEGGGLEVQGCFLQHPLSWDVSQFAVLVTGLQGRVAPSLGLGGRDVGGLRKLPVWSGLGGGKGWAGLGMV